MDEIAKKIALLFVLLFSLVFAGDSTGNETNETKDDDRERRNEFLEMWNSHKFQSDVPSPEGWMLQDTDKIMGWKGCDQTDMSTIDDPNAYTEIPTDYDYGLLVEAYLHAMANPHNSTHHRGGKYQREPSLKEYNKTHWEVPIEVRSIPHVGRGLFALRDIPKGTTIGCTRNTLFFYSKEAYRDFLAYLVLKQSKLFCDHFLWFYGYKVPTTDDPYDMTVGLDADSSSLINSGEWDNDDEEYDDYKEDEEDEDESAEDYDEDEDEEYRYYDYDAEEHEEDAKVESESESCVNKDRQCVDAAAEYGVGDTDKDEDETPIDRSNVGEYRDTATTADHGCLLYALRDIKAEEELLMSYGDFSEPAGFRIIGLDH